MKTNEKSPRRAWQRIDNEATKARIVAEIDARLQLHNREITAGEVPPENAPELQLLIGVMPRRYMRAQFLIGRVENDVTMREGFELCSRPGSLLLAPIFNRLRPENVCRVRWRYLKRPIAKPEVRVLR